MIKITQTIVGREKGTCMQAAVASLYELPLDKVPLFEGKEQNWAVELFNFMKSQHPEGKLPLWKERSTTEQMLTLVREDKGINGYFFAIVPSQTFEGVTHAVVVDENLKVVHDPNPNRLAEKLTPDDILDVVLPNTSWR